MKEPIISFVKSCEDEYKKFVAIENFPNYQVVSKEITIEKSQRQGFDSPAAAFYDIPTGAHTMEIWSMLFLPNMNAKYLVFHEFTHIWDAEKYSRKDKVKHMSNKGFTEYHAAQIDFLKLLGAKGISQQLSFSMDQSFETIGGRKSANEFVEMPRSLAIKLISRQDFPADLETLATTIGAIFNYYGRRSICKMYATDYMQETENDVIESFIGTNVVKVLDAFMFGWFDDNKVAILDAFYQKMIFTLARRYKLA